MKSKNGGNPTGKKRAAKRIKEARRLFRTIGETLNTVIELMKAGDLKDIDMLPRQMSRLTDALADVRRREAEFEATFKDSVREGDIDFDDLRREVGRRLGRIRTNAGADEISGEPD